MARVGQVPVYASQVLAEAKRSGKPARQALDDLVTMYLLAERARQDGRRPAASSDPEVESALVQRLLEVELEPRLRAEAVPDSVLRPLYEHAKHGFVHPRLVEIGMLAVYTGARMKPEPRLARQRTAEELAAFVTAHPPASLEEFAAIARKQEWAKRNVVYDRFFQSIDRPIERKIGQEIQRLRSVGETTGLLSNEDGFYIARYISEKPPENIGYEQARPTLLEAFHERWQQQQFAEYTSNLMKAHEVVAYFERLSLTEPEP
ncbi:MAG: hypothetical protein JXP73_20060 [Deltaproteobacteria bacterium]|nr:hypothetical protein [Deltaproteobacteria bacterium]